MACIKRVCDRFELPLPRLERCHELFLLVDESGDGSLQLGDFQRFFKALLRSAVKQAEREGQPSSPDQPLICSPEGGVAQAHDSSPRLSGREAKTMPHPTTVQLDIWPTEAALRRTPSKHTRSQPPEFEEAPACSSCVARNVSDETLSWCTPPRVVVSAPTAALVQPIPQPVALRNHAPNPSRVREASSRWYLVAVAAATGIGVLLMARLKSGRY